MTPFAFGNLYRRADERGIEIDASNVCGGHGRLRLASGLQAKQIVEAGPVKQNVCSVRKNPPDLSEGEANILSIGGKSILTALTELDSLSRQKCP